MADIAAVRAAAERIVYDSCSTQFGDGVFTVASYALATIPIDATLPIDAAWLREVWGFEDNCHEDYIEQAWELKTKHGRIAVWNFNDEHWLLRDMDSFPLTTRAQFMQLMTALGIQPQPPKAKE